MMAPGVARARSAARRLLRQCGVETADHIAVEAIAAHAGATVVRSRGAGLDSAMARLVRMGDHAVIRVSDRIDNVGAQRFSIAHELGHFVLGHQESPVPLCDAVVSRRSESAEIELEANSFAAELLMPESLVRRRCEVSPVTLDIPRSIATEYRVSLLAAARRFVELTSERCALVFTMAGAVRWSARSATFVPQIEPGRRLDRDTVAFDIQRGKLDDRPQEVPVSAWIDMSDDGGAELIEHAVPVPEQNAVASLLWVREREAVSLRCFA